jgi:chromosomal replication initiator protein
MEVVIDFTRRKTRVPDEINAEDFANLKPENIFLVVCHWYGIDPDLINSKSRKRELVAARHMCCYFLTLDENMPFQTIAKFVGCKSHATVMHSRNTVETYMRLYKEYREEVITLFEKLRLTI